MDNHIKKYISDIPQLVNDWDWDKNDISPNKISYGSAIECFWKCAQCGHSWSTRAYTRGARGSGCPKCARRQRGISKMRAHANKNSFIDNYPEIAKEWHPTKNQNYDINNISSFSNVSVYWICSKCEREWKTSVNHRTKEGTGCPDCSKNRAAMKKIEFHSKLNNFAEQYPEIAKEWHPYKNGKLMPMDVSASSNKRIWWECSFCKKEWKTTVNHRTSGENCPACNPNQTSFPEQAIFYYVSLAYSDAVSRAKIDGIEFDVFIPSINTAIEYDGTRYHSGDIALEKDNKKDLFCKEKEIFLFRFRESILKDTNHAVRITCVGRKIDDSITELLNRIAKGNCISIDSQRDRQKIVARLRQSIVENSVFAKRPELQCEWNYRKNGNRLPEVVYCNANYKVWWKCQQCGYEWQATPNHRNNGRGCPACAGKICRTGYNDLMTLNPFVAQEWNYEKNYPLTPENVASKSNKKVWWICSKGHEYDAQISERNRGEKSTGCPYCANKKICVGFNDLNTTHPELAREWHPTKNGDLKPTMVTAGSKKKVWWRCEENHEWQAVVYSRKKGKGCRICYNKKLL